MEYEKIKELINYMENSKLTSLELELPDGTKISMKKEQQQVVKMPEVVKETKTEIIEEVKKEEGYIVKSPMVGTFYAKPDPNSKPYVELGQKVKKGDVLCIVEAMKLMNEIESEFSGEIAEILVKDGEVVEYGKPLFRIV